MQQNTILPYLVFIKPNFPWNQLLTMDSMLNWRASGILRNIFLYILEEIRFNRPLSFSSFWTLQVKLSKCGLVFPAQEGLKIRGCQLWFGGHNLPTLVEIGLTDLPKSGGGGGLGNPAPPGTTSLGLSTLTCQIIVQQILLFFGRKNAYTTLLGPTRLLISENIPSKPDFHLHKWEKNPSYTALLWPTRLLISEKSATYMINWYYTNIWQVRVDKI